MESVDRFYRSYSKYLRINDDDSLFTLLNSLHSLNEKLKSEHAIDLFEIDEFVTLKAIRNYLHHQGEIGNFLTTIPAGDIFPIQTDMIFMCLIRKKDLDKSIKGIQKKYREKHRIIINKTVHIYGEAINIGHVIFNMAAKLIIFLNNNGVTGKSKEYLNNYNSVLSDINGGYNITVSGKLYSHINNAGKIEDVLFKLIKSND